MPSIRDDSATTAKLWFFKNHPSHVFIPLLLLFAMLPLFSILSVSLPTHFLSPSLFPPPPPTTDIRLIRASEVGSVPVRCVQGAANFPQSIQLSVMVT